MPAAVARDAYTQARDATRVCARTLTRSHTHARSLEYSSIQATHDLVLWLCSYAVHLFSSGGPALAHLGEGHSKLTVKSICARDTNFNRLVRPFVEGLEGCAPRAATSPPAPDPIRPGASEL
jgi:hypothetical protein